MAAWQDSRGVQWVLVPFWGPVSRTFRAPVEYGRPKMGGAAAFKLEETSEGEWQLNPTWWTSRDLAAPLTPIVVNGVAFAASGPSNAPAALYAMDGATGKPLWQSENAMTSPLSGRSFWIGSGHAFVGTRDGTIYAFGFAMERK